MDFVAQDLMPYRNALMLRAQRQSLLAANIANADVPGYKARDFDFAAQLDASLGKGGAAGMARTQTGHLGMAAGRPQAEVQYRVPHQQALDGNTVEVESEMPRMLDNALRYQATLTFINGKVQKLLAAIKDHQ